MLPSQSWTVQGKSQTSRISHGVVSVTARHVQQSSRRFKSIVPTDRLLPGNESVRRWSPAQFGRDTESSRPASGNISGPAGVGSLAVLDSRSRLPVELQQFPPDLMFDRKSLKSLNLKRFLLLFKNNSCWCNAATKQQRL